MSKKGYAGWTATLRSGYEDYWDNNTRPSIPKNNNNLLKRSDAASNATVARDSHGKTTLVETGSDGRPCLAGRVRVQKRSKTVLETDLPNGLQTDTLIGLHGANRRWLQQVSGANTIEITDESHCMVVHAATQQQAKHAIILAHGQFKARHDRGEALASSGNDRCRIDPHIWSHAQFAGCALIASKPVRCGSVFYNIWSFFVTLSKQNVLVI